MEIWTNGSIKPSDSLSLASKYLMEHYELIANINDIISTEEYMHEREEKVTNKKT